MALPHKTYPSAAKAPWPYRLPSALSSKSVSELHDAAHRIAGQSQYGWGQTIDFGAFRIEGLFGEHYLEIAGLLDEWGWWAQSMRNMRVADVGCYTGGSALLMAARGARVVYAVDELPEHLAQCRLLTRVFKVRSIRCLEVSLFRLAQHIPAATLDIILLSGVLYHLSDLLVGLLILQTLLKPGGALLIESAAVECFKHSYANFCRFVGGAWWKPTGLCIQDLCEFAGLECPQVRFYASDRCLAKAVKPSTVRIPFKRGMNWSWPNLKDERPRPTDIGLMAPAVCEHD